MQFVFILFQLSLWFTGICALAVATPVVRDEAKSQDDDPCSRGFVTFQLVKKATISSKFKIDDALAPNGGIVGGIPVGTSPVHASITERDHIDGYKVVKAQKPIIENSAGVDQDGTDYSYFAEVHLGSEGKPLFMLLDTGASTTWVMGSDCTSKSCLIHSTFGPDDSKSFNDTGKSYSVDYGTGSVRGRLVEDELSLAGLSVTLPFGVASTTTDQFTQFPFDGILGLSTSSDTWLAAVKEANLIKSNIFGISLSRNSDGTNDGEIVFGGLNEDKYKGDITYTSINTPGGAWMIPMDDVLVGGDGADITGRSAYIDTGTSFIFGPPDDVKAMYKLIPGSSSTDGATYTVPCDSDREIAFTFSGKTWAINTKDFISSPNSKGNCNGNVYGKEYVKNGWLLGDVFLKNVYGVFDIDNSRIGFAAKTEPDARDPTTTTTTVPTATAASTSSTVATASSTAASDSDTGVHGQGTPTSTEESAPEPTDSNPSKPESAGGKLGLGTCAALLVSLLSTVALSL
ncbi:aspartic peptidase domain-containing protein [Poronia punctata]|nr:aspartic peptidase domain-containing protein [Poronia punctata]